MAKSVPLSAEEKSRYEELSEKVKEMLSGGNRLTSKELAEYSKLKDKKNMAESPLFRKQMEHEAKIERRYKMAKGGSIKVGDKVRSTVYNDISGEVISKKGEMLMVVGKNKNNPSKVSHEVLNINEVEKMAKGGVTKSEKSIIQDYKETIVKKYDNWITRTQGHDLQNFYKDDKKDHLFVIEKMKQGRWKYAYEFWQGMDSDAREQITNDAYDLLMNKNNVNMGIGGNLSGFNYSIGGL